MSRSIYRHEDDEGGSVVDLEVQHCTGGSSYTIWTNGNAESVTLPDDDALQVAYAIIRDQRSSQPLEDRIAALAALAAAGKASRAELAEAGAELRAAIVEAVRPVLPALCSPVPPFAGAAPRRGISIAIGAPAGAYSSPVVLLESGEFTPAAPHPADLADALAQAIDRQLGGNLPARVDELRAQAAIMRALAGALRGMREASAPKKMGAGAVAREEERRKP